MKTCTEKEQENCEYELLGCDGCYFNKKDNNCLHCNNNKPLYCEECYQKLIGENAKLQKEVKELEISNKELDKECTRLERKEKELEEILKKYRKKEATGDNAIY